MTRCIVLLRGVNVGKAKRIAMADFRAALEAVGCVDVRTHLSSGNAVVDWPAEPAALGAAVRAALRDGGLDVAVMVRTAEQLSRVVRASPWTDLDPKLFHVGFLSGDPDPAKVAAIDHEGLRPERVVVGERVLYLDYAGGVHGSRGLARLDVGVDVTARNWRTVCALHDLAG